MLLQLVSGISTSTILLIVTGLGILWKLNQLVTMLAIEHEVLVEDYCERKGVKRSELPTRTNLLARSMGAGRS